MLFLLVMEVLNGLHHKVDEWKLLHPFGPRTIFHRAFLYVDDLVIFMLPDSLDLTVLRWVLELFEESSGLGCNMGKCLMVSIRCSEEQVHSSALQFPCEVVPFPIKYLGLPLSVTKILRAALQPLMDRTSDKLPS
jgi:hypothetical protein